MGNIPRSERLMRKRAELAVLDSGETRRVLVAEIDKLEKAEARARAREDRARRYAGLTTTEMALVERALAEKTNAARNWIRSLLVECGNVSREQAMELIPPLPTKRVSSTP